MASPFRPTTPPAAGGIMYHIDGVPFYDYGVWVSKSDGLLGVPKRKAVNAVDWPEEHGVTPDLNAVVIDSRQITLQAFVTGVSMQDLLQRIDAFAAAWQKPGLRQLVVDTGAEGARPLVYMVYLAGSMQPKGYFEKAGQYKATMQLQLVEPRPVKIVLRYTHAAGQPGCALSFVSPAPIDVYWGNGAACLDVRTGHTATAAAADASALAQLGNNPAAPAAAACTSYDAPGQYFVVLAGNVEMIKNLSLDPYTSRLWPN